MRNPSAWYFSGVLNIDKRNAVNGKDESRMIFEGGLFVSSRAYKAKDNPSQATINKRRVCRIDKAYPDMW